MIRLKIGGLYYHRERKAANSLEEWDNLPNYIGMYISGQRGLKKEWRDRDKIGNDILIELEPFFILEEFFEKGFDECCDGYVYRVIQNHDIGNVAMGYFKLIEYNKSNFKLINELKIYRIFAASGGQT